MKQERNIVLAIILSLVTCGIYGIFWFIVLTDDVKEYSEDESMQSGVVAFLLTLITCGIYGLYWAYKMGQLTAVAQQKNNLPIKDNSILYLVLLLIGFSIIDYCLIQNDLNEITRLKNGNSNGGEQVQNVQPQQRETQPEIKHHDSKNQ